MQIYLINGKNSIGKTDFAVNLAERLSENKMVLLTSLFRSDQSNIEDYYKKDGMISYDISDYFLGLCSLDKVIVEENPNLKFIIPPLVEDKYDIRVQDVYNLIDEVDADIIILDNLYLAIKDAIKIEILDKDDLDKDIHADYYFINRCDEGFDPRTIKEKLLSKSATYLGFVKENDYFKDVIDNLMKGEAEPIGDLGFFEKVKRIFKK
ncbi:P-loop NTPase family protein [Anaerococcus degeneri]|uniref:Uncharacterized protein n=1 Tax=Anaerococcus degeneri TaxID=361500 RepID=A0ABS7YV92_9FIRM|nr:hypothetical protein [Anaerococcus degeneri]MBP2015896.1 CO dehydrogenase nickel-insertion accessory protein CooC1 [Anaerococcus degeneri]MCA2095646.1 hypothetical protein [Anaerococcus degeneri]